MIFATYEFICHRLLIIHDNSQISHTVLSITRHLKVHYPIHKGRKLVPVLSQINPVHNFLSLYVETHFNIILSILISLPYQHHHKEAPIHALYLALLICHCFSTVSVTKKVTNMSQNVTFFTVKSSIL